MTYTITVMTNIFELLCYREIWLFSHIW